MKINKFQKKPIVASILGFFCVSAYAIEHAPGVVYHPIHYKPAVSHLLPSGLSPKQVSLAYGFNTIAAQGKGQIIAIVDAYDDPRIEQDLAVFSKQFGLPTCTTKNGCFKKIYASGKKPRTDAGWAGEIALDVEWAHAMAPQAKIILVEAATASTRDLFHAVQVAIDNHANVVSMSWGAPEFSSQTSFDAIFNNPNVSFTASSGDDGTGVIYPASSPYVLAVGGTSLYTDHTGNYQSEAAWSGSGGGLSAIYPWPSYQSGLPTPDANYMRGVPDVAYDADPNTGFSVYDSVAYNGSSGWMVIGGTSAGAPQWAALIAVANSSASHNIGGKIQTLLYGAANPSSGDYSVYFNDILDGNNGSCGFYCTAIGGYDYVTGLGSPKVPAIEQLFQHQPEL